MRKDFSPVLKLALQRPLEYLNNVDEEPVGATASLSELRESVCKAWNTEGMDASQVVDDLVRDTAGGLNNSVNARFYAWVIGGSLPSALAANWLTSTWDQNAGMYTLLPQPPLWKKRSGSGLKICLVFPQRIFCPGDRMPDGEHNVSGRSAFMAAQAPGWDVDGRASPVLRRLLSSAALACYHRSFLAFHWPW